MTVLYVSRIKVETDNQLINLVELSRNAKSLILQTCNLPPGLLSSLFEQDYLHSNLRRLCLFGSKLYDITCIGLHKMTSLSVLDLRNTKVSLLFCESVCKQLKFLGLIEELLMTGIPVGPSCRYITEAVEAWGPDGPLQVLHLGTCKIPTPMCVSLISAISKCTGLKDVDLSQNGRTSGLANPPITITERGSLSALESFKMVGLKMPYNVCCTILSSLSYCQLLSWLDLSGNNLKGSLKHFLPDSHSVLSSLAVLHLNSTGLNEEDIFHIRQLVDTDKLPALSYLDLISNNLGRMEHVVDVLIEACVSHMERNLDGWMTLNLNLNRFSPEFETKTQNLYRAIRIKFI